MAKKKKEWKFKHTLKGEWANIVIQSDFFKLGGIITDAYDYAVRELNQKGEKAMNIQDKLHVMHRKVVEEHTEFMEKYRLLKIEYKKEKAMLQENLDQCQRNLLEVTEQRDRADEALGLLQDEFDLVEGEGG